MFAEPDVSTKPQSPPPPRPQAAEVSEFHTRILRLTLAAADSRSYWDNVDPATPVASRATRAFEQRWFGAKSLERVRYLVGTFAARFDVFPNALSALRRWRSMDVASRQLICHWHLQLCDPLYRRFTGEFLIQRRALPGARIDREGVLRWLRGEFPDRWAEATLVQFASKLLSTALEAGLVSKRDPRTLLFPKVLDQPLAYLLYLLRETRFQGGLSENPYLASVGLGADVLPTRARSLPGLSFRRAMRIEEWEWRYEDLGAWAQAEIG